MKVFALKKVEKIEKRKIKKALKKHLKSREKKIKIGTRNENSQIEIDKMKKTK